MILTKKMQEKVDERIEHLRPGIESKWSLTSIKSNYGTMTAHEWKTWVMFASNFCLKDILPEHEYRNWGNFVRACMLMSTPQVHRKDIERADKYFDAYGRGLAQNPQATGDKGYYNTPNLHLHTHLNACIDDFGPVYSFWLFSYERWANCF